MERTFSDAPFLSAKETFGKLASDLKASTTGLARPVTRLAERISDQAKLSRKHVTVMMNDATLPLGSGKQGGRLGLHDNFRDDLGRRQECGDHVVECSFPEADGEHTYKPAGRVPSYAFRPVFIAQAPKT